MAVVVLSRATPHQRCGRSQMTIRQHPLRAIVSCRASSKGCFRYKRCRQAVSVSANGSNMMVNGGIDLRRRWKNDETLTNGFLKAA